MKIEERNKIEEFVQNVYNLYSLYDKQEMNGYQIVGAIEMWIEAQKKKKETNGNLQGVRT